MISLTTLHKISQTNKVRRVVIHKQFSTYLETEQGEHLGKDWV